MSEYSESNATTKLIGAPPGYVGYEKGGALTEKVRRHPYSVVLFDEIEKAHEDVIALLLQITDDGFLTDSDGRRVNFRNTYVILTSNAGFSSSQSFGEVGFLSTKDNDAALGKFFKPELIGRIDEIIYFSPLSRDTLIKIAEKELNELATRLEKNCKIVLLYEQSVSYSIVESKDVKKKGARVINRIITSKIENPIAEMIISAKLQNGEKITLKFVDNELIFENENKKANEPAVKIN